jgi:hypothetical protein
MTRHWLAAWTWKEFRALFPLWAACAIPILARDLVSGYFLPMIATLAYGVGSIALGAQSVGYEFGYGTMGILLAQPADRRRIYAVKVAVLAAFLGALWFAASLTLLDEREFRSTAGGPPPPLPAIIALLGLGVAPLLTMASRSWIAGGVFTITIPGMLWLAISLVGVARFGTEAAGPIDRFTEALFWPAMYGICAAAAVASWRTFGRLQAIERPGTELHVRFWRVGASSSARTGNRAGRPTAIGQLIAKELHLHQMTFVVAGVYVISVLATAAVRALNPRIGVDPVVVFTVLYVFTIASLIGAFASAGERQLGTHEWQLLTPLAAWRQWGVKIGVAVTLIAVLAFGIAAALAPLTPDLWPTWTREWKSFVTIVAVLTAACVYVSSFSTSGIRALLVTFPLLFCVQYVLLNGLFLLARVFHAYHIEPAMRIRLPLWGFMLLTIATVCIPLTALAYRNHRSAEHSWMRVTAQILALMAFWSTAGAILTLLGI